MRAELAVALVAGILLALYGLVDILTGARGGSRSLDARLARISAGAATALIVLALALGARRGGWPGWMPGEALLAAAGGAALLLSTREYNLKVRALASLLAGVVIFIATVVNARSMPVGGPPQAGSWLFGLRLLAFAPGAGMWLLVAAAALAGARWGRGRDVDNGGDGDTRNGARPAIPGDAARDAGRMAIATGYPWLTLALALTVAWNLAAHAMIWRSTAAELWLLVAWLLGAAYLLPGLGGVPAGVRRAWLAALALAGLAAVLFAASQAPSWL